MRTAASTTTACLRTGTTVTSGVTGGRAVENTLTEEQALAVYEVLVMAGASISDQPAFVEAQTSKFVGEWRFGGFLGFGGKFYREPSAHRLGYVSCYPEDATPERRQMIVLTNALLSRL